ncbi:MAG: energy transducer TonB, partial [Burkholderiales bacterium]
MSARLLIVVAVVGLHALGLWGLHSGMLRHVGETVVPVRVLADFVPLPQFRAEPPAPPPAPAPQPEPPRARPAPVRPPA